MLSILTDADSVELKMSVPDADRRSAIAALGFDPLVADVVQIWFFDTVDLDLNASGVIARVRRTKARDDSTVKLRPVIPNDLPGKLRARSGFGVEIDAMPGGFVCSGRLKEKLKPGTVRKAMLGGKPPTQAVQQAAARVLRAARPARPDSRRPGAARADHGAQAEVPPAGFDRAMVAELWMYPDGSRILELSTKCEPAEAFIVAAAGREFLLEHGIVMTGVQQTKTKTALEHFAHELRGPRGRRVPLDRRPPRCRAQLLDRRHRGEAPEAVGRTGAGEALPHPDRRRTHQGAASTPSSRSSTSAARTPRRSSSSSSGPRDHAEDESDDGTLTEV